MAKLTVEEKEARKQARMEADAKRMTREREDKNLVLTAMRSILSDHSATPSQRIYAFAVLDNMQYYHFAPYNLPYPDKPEEIDLSRLREKFAEELAEAQPSDR